MDTPEPGSEFWDVYPLRTVSENWIVVIPRDPEALPEPGHRATAEAVFRRSVGAAAEVVVKLTDQPQFVDCGENYERAICPACGGDPGLDWLGTLYEGDGFRMAVVELPCCAARVQPSEVEFEWPCGFARFQIAARDASATELSDDQLHEIASALALPVRQVLQHY